MDSNKVYHPKYLVAHACFNCRKSFKRSPSKLHKCPQCSREAFSMGRAFKAPKQKDTKQWEKVKILYAHGFRFHKYGGEYENLPETISDVDEFINNNSEHKLKVAEINLALLD